MKYINLRKQDNNLRGTIGECMLKIARKNCAIASLTNKQRWFNYFSQYFTKNILDFIENYWTSLDVIEVQDKNTQPKLILFEVKSYDATFKGFNHKPSISENSVAIYNAAMKLGIKVFIAKISLHDNWRFAITYEPFEEGKYHVYKQRYLPKNPLKSHESHTSQSDQ